MHIYIRAACAAAVLLLASQSRADEPAWVGVFVNEAQSSEGIESAIETAVAKMSFITRPIARSRLKKTNPAYTRIEIAQRGDVISVRFDDRAPIETPANGASVKWTRDDGEVFDVSTQVEQGALVQTFRAEDGERVNRFTANELGQMTMETTITSPQLKTPVIYTLLYERRPR